MTEKELATYESVNAMLMLIGDFTNKVDHYREHVYDKQLESNLIDRINSTRDILHSISSDLVDYEEFWIKKHKIKAEVYYYGDDNLYHKTKFDPTKPTSSKPPYNPHKPEQGYE